MKFLVLILNKFEKSRYSLLYKINKLMAIILFFIILYKNILVFHSFSKYNTFLFENSFLFQKLRK